MAALNPVEADVRKVTESVSTSTGLLESTVSCDQGELLSTSSAGNLIKSSNDTVANASVTGLSLSKASAGKTVDFVNVIGTEINLGVTVTPNEWYCVGSVAGTIVPKGDITSGQVIQYVGYGNKNSNLIWYPIKTSETLA